MWKLIKQNENYTKKFGCGTFYRICDNCLCQDENNPWVVTIATNAVDSYPTNQPNVDIVGKHSSVNKENYFIVQTIGIFSLPSLPWVSRNIAERFSITYRQL